MDSNPVGFRPILVWHRGALGDWILSLPALYALHRFHEEAHPWLMALNPQIIPLLSCVEIRVQGVFADHYRWFALWRKGGSGIERLGRFLTAYVFGRSPDEVLLQNLERICDRAPCFVSTFPPTGERIHVWEHQQTVLGEAGIEYTLRHPPLRPPEPAIRWAREWFRSRGIQEAPLLFHPGSGSPKKNWPFSRFQELARWFEDARGVTVVFLRGPAERGFGEKERLILENESLDRVAAVLSLCRGYVGNDSGITHLAAVLHVPTLALFGPTDPRIWGPRGSKVRILRKGNGMHGLGVSEVRREGEAFFFGRPG